MFGDWNDLVLDVDKKEGILVSLSPTSVNYIRPDVYAQ